MATRHRGLTSMAHKIAASVAAWKSEMRSMRARSMFSSTSCSPHVHRNMFPKTCFQKHVPKDMFSDTCPQFHILCTYIHSRPCVSRPHVIIDFLHSIFAIRGQHPSRCEVTPPFLPCYCEMVCPFVSLFPACA